MAEPDTVELSVGTSGGAPDARVPVWRGITGSLTAGWVVVLVVLAGAQGLAWSGESEGPGAYPLVGHGVGVVLAGYAQRQADRTRGARAGAAGAGVAVVSLLLLWLFWWS
ncbi:hypothetical protein B1813_17680 [Saccharomonospora piscinae]|uniref:Uncharacterized protein n=1 Tax=Saccharomonospora piscinae TaxID=687388 RepID=A0A1V8ZZN8_SACPI|nr:hypothetical protein [Saccharomonospora piscinae]OQO90261.1 hypothetical protein B1813_17680 [Saccharomonospora piscinae]TLW89675.1 hypothetical protein FFT09_22105 [Saccharomonospora piscinae]